MQPSPGLHTLAELHAAGPETVGGKAHGLCRMQAAGLPVPAAAVLLPDGEGRVAVDPAAVEEMLGPGPYFVRSSFAVEDRHGQSFAGQGRTLGHLRAADLPDAVAAVWSAWDDDGAAAYRRRHGLGGERAGGVVIQREVIPIWSGVVFTRSPEAVGRWARIEAAKGYGEAVVQGLVDPVVLDVHARSGKLLRPAPTPELAAAVGELRPWLASLEAAVDGPADGEWAYDARGRLWLLQVRPATATAPAIWSGALGDEFWSGTVSPLMFATAGRAIESAMLAEPMAVLEDPPRQALLRRAGGRIYINTSELAKGLPVIPPWAVTETVLRVFPPAIRNRYEAERAVRKPLLPIEFLRAGLRFLGRRFPWLPGLQPLALGRLRRRADRWRDRRVPDRAPELVAEVDAILAALRGALRWVVWGMIYAYTMVPLLDFLLGERARRPGAGALYHDLPFDPVAELDRDLRRFARAYPEAVDAPDDADFRERLDKAGRRELAKLTAKWAHRAEERDLRGRRWEEEPAAVWLLLRLARSEPAPPRRHWFVWLVGAYAPWRRPMALPALLAAIPVAGLARLYLGFRERMRDVADRYLLALRRRILALARATGEPDPWARSWLPGEGLAPAPDDDPLDPAGRAPAFLVGDEPMPEPAAEGGGLAGTGVSHGVGEGRAVWIETLEDLEGFRPGDVLLASYLDPSLSLALESAAGAAFVYGGMLSHGAIIAREYGVPAVVGIGDLATVAAGSRVRVDGVAGTVTVVDRG